MGECYSPRTFYDKFRQILWQAGISHQGKGKGPRVHDLRHTFAVHLLQAGVAIIYIRDFLGHESVKTTEVYAKADGKSKRAALDAAYSAALDTELPARSWNDDDNLMEFLTNLCSE